jgi:hypothetical protein
MVTRGIDAPERLLFITETQLKKIRGVSIEEIRAYRARFVTKGSCRISWQNGQLVGFLLLGVCPGFVAYVFVDLVF